MKIVLYFIKNKLNCATLTINGVAHATHDCRLIPGEPNEVCLVTSKITVKNNDGLDTDDDMQELVEEGTATKREFETEPIYTEWNDWGLSFTTIKHAFVKPPCGKCNQCKCALDV